MRGKKVRFSNEDDRRLMKLLTKFDFDIRKVKDFGFKQVPTKIIEKRVETVTGRPITGFVSSKDVGIAREGEGIYNPLAKKLQVLEKSSVAGESTIGGSTKTGNSVAGDDVYILGTEEDRTESESEKSPRYIDKSESFLEKIQSQVSPVKEPDTPMKFHQIIQEETSENTYFFS